MTTCGSPRSVKLHQLVNRDGRDQAVKVLTQDHAGWSHLDPDCNGEIKMVGYDDGRFEAIKGYGVAYTTTKLKLFGEKAYQQVRKSDWIRHDGDDNGTEYAYVLCRDQMWVCSRRYADGSQAVGMFGLDAAPTESGGHWDTLAIVKYREPWPELLLG